MANNLDKFYNTFTGLDTRSNKLLQPPGSFRRGSKNLRYNFQDETQNANGFQHKDLGAPTFVDIFEYKYRNVDTGAAETQVLGVSTAGNLYRKLNSTLTFNTHGVATSVSVYYDEVDDTFKCGLAGLGSVTISDTMTLAQLETALELLAGVTVTITGDSSVKAYLLDCVINDNTFANNVAYYWEIVPFPNSSSVPFTTTRDFNTDSNYEGISSINLNNVIYITDGGFPMKYDGYSVHRAGVPSPRQIYDGTTSLSVSQLSGTTASVITDSTLIPIGLASGVYGYRWRFGYRDKNGAEYFSRICDYSTLLTFNASFQAGRIENIGYKFGKDFPVFACRINSSAASATAGGTGADGAINYTLDTVLSADVNATNLTIAAGVNVYLNGYSLRYTGVLSNSGTITNAVTARSGGNTTYAVTSGHNVIAGQCLVLKTSTATNTYPTSSFFDGYYYAKVISTTATSITVTTPTNITVNAYGSEPINAAWVPADIENTKDKNGYFDAPFGAFIEIFRCKVGEMTSATADGPLYIVGHSSLPIDNNSSLFFDDRPDVALNVLYPDLELGDEIPRACKYLTQAQTQLIQSGRPVDWTLKNDEYPSSAFTVAAATYKDLAKYTEALLCDYQSVYWADALSPEGFSQDGLHEFSIDTKFADRVTGIAPNKDSLFAFKERSTAVLSGSFATNEIVMEVLESDAGCVSHRTIEEIRGTLIWLDGINGFYSCVAGRLPENIGFPIQDYTKINAEKLNFRNANAANFRKESLYVCSVGTTTFIFDYADDGTLKRNCWYLWDRIDGKSVLATSNDELLIWDGIRTWKMKTTRTRYDFTDHKSAISFILNTAWATQGYPTIDKHYVNLWMNSIQGDFTLTVKQYGNFLEDQVASQSNVYFIPENSSKKAIKEPVKAYLPKLSSISFGMENTEKNKWVRLQGYEIQYSPDFNTGEPKR